MASVHSPETPPSASPRVSFGYVWSIVPMWECGGVVRVQSGLGPHRPSQLGESRLLAFLVWLTGGIEIRQPQGHFDFGHNAGEGPADLGLDRPQAIADGAAAHAQGRGG